MRTKIFNALKVSVIAVLMTVGISYVYAQYALPTATPPGNNPAGFIDISAVSQSKAGGLKTGTLQTSTLGVGAAPSTAAGVYVASGGALNIGVLGGNINPTGYGVYGNGNTGVFGASTAGSNGTGVLGQGPLLGVQGVGTDANYGTGVIGQGGNSGMGVGVFGNGHTGVFGQGTLGVEGNGTVADFASMSTGIMFHDGTLQKTAYSTKLCSAVSPGNWRDTITVPSTWTRANCGSYAAGVGATSWQVACIESTSVTWGADGGGMPAYNTCGWDAPLPPPPPSGCSPLAVFKGICTP